MQRDMSYELDDAFSTRNDGEVLLVDEPRPRVLRGGGSLSIRRPNAVALRDAGPIEVDAEVMSGGGSRAAVDLAGDAGVVAVPGLGNVNLIHVGVAVAAGALLMWLLNKKD
jgi:hypothetical protein